MLASIKCWVLSSRPKTLVVGISPVLIGTSIASIHQPITVWVFLLCFFFSVFLQLGTNWSNDYFDFIKGTDTRDQPSALSYLLLGKIVPRSMLAAALISFFIAAMIACPLLERIGWSYIPLLLISIACGYLYTGSKWAFGYLGWGDLLVILFFGPVGTCFTAYSQMLYFPTDALIASMIPGFLSCAIICTNNMRDVIGDQRANKRTLVVRWGTRFGQWEYLFCVALSLLSPVILWWMGWPSQILLLLLLAPLLRQPISLIWRQKNNLDHALMLTARFLVCYTFFFCLISFIISKNYHLFNITSR